jgi:hypothetical protein
MPHEEDAGEPIPIPMADPRGTAGDELIPAHLNPTAQLGAETTRKYITPMGKARFGELYGETTWVPGSPEHPEEGHSAIVYNTEEREKDPSASKETLKHELEHAGVKESIHYQKDLVANNPFVLSGGEELRQRLSDIARIQALGPAAMRSSSYREQLRQAQSMVARLTKSLGDKFNMTPEEVTAKVKSYQADINQAVRKAEEVRQNKLNPVTSAQTQGAQKPGAPAQTKAEKMDTGPKGKVDEDTHARWHSHHNPIKITNNSGDYDMHWTDQNSELSTAPL